MAAHRQFVPVRDTENVFRIEDGTMCRMASPAPGPLRSEQDHPVHALKDLGNRDGRLPGLTAGAGIATSASRTVVAESFKFAKAGSDRN